MIQSVQSFYFQQPEAFWALLLLPMLVWTYRQYRANRLKTAFRYSPVAVIASQLSAPPLWKRLFLPASILVLTALLIVGLARPTLVGKIPTRQVAMMVVLDISLSMMADDIEPTRLEAAKTAAIAFIDNLPPDVHVGLELFAGNNYVVQAPTRDHAAVTAYLKSLSQEHLQLRTEIGSALRTALDTLNSTPLTPADNGQSAPDAGGGGRPIDYSKVSKVILLLSDGDSQEGYPWHIAASRARENQILINTVGIGSNQPGTITYGGQNYPVIFNESTLRQIAAASGGQYFRVFQRSDFARVYEQIQSQSLVYETRTEDVTYLVVILALAWMLFAQGVWLVWIRTL